MKINNFVWLLRAVSFSAFAFFGFSVSAFAQITPINQIQGASNISPFAEKQITTGGIVTAIVAKGFYLQTPDAETDGDAQTSEGIYVFTNNEKADVAVGDQLEVSGTISEYQPRQERYALKLTEITRPTVKIVSKNNPLPAPIVLTNAELAPTGKLDQLERFEGMRVAANELMIVP